MRTLTSVVDEIKGWTDIPTELKSRGVKGIRGNCNFCPIANYVLRETNAARVKVFAEYVQVSDAVSPLDFETADLNLRVTEFIEEFDGEAYPELDEEISA